MKLRVFAFLLPLVALAAGDGFAPKEKAEALDAIVHATDRTLPKESDDAYRVRRGRSFVAQDTAMREASLAWVGGAVVRSGYVEVKKGMRAGDVLVRAQGFGPFSAHRRLVITRFDERGQKTSMQLLFSSDIPSAAEIASSPVLLASDRLFAIEEMP